MSKKNIFNILSEYLKHTALNLGQAARDIRYFFNSPDADKVARVNSVKHKFFSIFYRFKPLLNNILYSLLPPRLHHSKEELKDLKFGSSFEWFLRGLAPWKHSDPSKKGK